MNASLPTTLLPRTSRPGVTRGPGVTVLRENVLLIFPCQALKQARSGRNLTRSACEATLRITHHIGWITSLAITVIAVNIWQPQRMRDTVLLDTSCVLVLSATAHMQTPSAGLD